MHHVSMTSTEILGLGLVLKLETGPQDLVTFPTKSIKLPQSNCCIDNLLAFGAHENLRAPGAIASFA